MKITVIIVNYNVKYFLEQCLCSLRAAIAQTSVAVETIVMDNISTDDSIHYLQPKFPEVQFYNNSENEGFSKANNKALLKATGDLILFLNPDTIVSEGSLQTCVDFFKTQPGAGAVGLKMIDGSGNYLHESKRGFPTPWVSFCKMTGLARIFPHSALFSGYYLGNLNENSLQEIEALAGAFMMVPAKLLQQTGGFDERFFMYAEDIDLSYRIQKAGYANYYLPEPALIHFKGESTHKDSIYIERFYGAMVQFVDKHYASASYFLTKPLLKLGIRIRAFVAKMFISEKAENRSKTPQNVEKMIELAQNSSKIGHFRENGQNLLITGPGFSFSDLIRTMQKNPGEDYFIHATGSGAIVSSNRSHARGQQIPLQN